MYPFSTFSYFVWNCVSVVTHTRVQTNKKVNLGKELIHFFDAICRRTYAINQSINLYMWLFVFTLVFSSYQVNNITYTRYTRIYYVKGIVRILSSHTKQQHFNDFIFSYLYMYTYLLYIYIYILYKIYNISIIWNAWPLRISSLLEHFDINLFLFFFPLQHQSQQLCLKRVWACDFPIPNSVSKHMFKISNCAIHNYDLLPK